MFYFHVAHSEMMKTAKKKTRSDSKKGKRKICMAYVILL